jgi:hypothetical protein
MKHFSILLGTILLSPLATSAAVNPPTNFASFVANLVSLIQIFIYFIFALAFLVFAWGLMKMWIFNGGDEKSVSEGKKLVVAGIIGLVVMFTVWGLVRLLQTTFFGG